MRREHEIELVKEEREREREREREERMRDLQDLSLWCVCVSMYTSKAAVENGSNCQL